MRRIDLVVKIKKMRKKEKRERKKKERGIVDFVRIVFHFFRNINQWIQEIKDPRHPSYILYQQNELLFMGILKNICAIESMRQMEERFNEETCIEILSFLSGNKDLDEMPHYDTLNNYLAKLSPQALSCLRSRMIKQLIKSKVGNHTRLMGKYFRIILDGTGLFYFKERHCEHCLSEKHTRSDGKKQMRYYHKVLEAKLILGEKLVLSIDTEFIENEQEDVSKQDCEINAAKRLLKRLKQAYPRLPICIQGDALYAAESIMKRCRRNGWVYLLTQKETRQKLIAESYEFVKVGSKETEVCQIGKEHGTANYVNGVEKTAGKMEVMNVFEYSYETEEDGEVTQVMFAWITNIKVTKRNVEQLIEAGRGRWKIENEGFNNQKNGQYRISHLSSRNKNAMKNHYLITQIADILMQLYLSWTPLVNELGYSIQYASSCLLESFRTRTMSQEDECYIQKYTTIYLE